MINIQRNNFDSALSQITDLDAVNAQGGVAAWTLPPRVMRAYNPIVFTGTVFYAVTASRPAPSGKIPNFATAILEGGASRVRFTYPVQSTVRVTFKADGGTDGVEETITVAVGEQESTTVLPYYAHIISISPTQDSYYTYLLGGDAYDGGDYLVTSSGTVFYRDTEAIAPISLSFVDGYNYITTLSAEPYRGQAQINVSAVVRSMFTKELTAYVEGIAAEQAQGVTYTISADGTDLGTYLGINGVAQVGESADMTDVTTPLTLFGSLYRYAGYELTASVISGTDVLRIGLNSGDAGMPIAIEDRCTPPAPFYVRWINTLGGVDYWMFSKSQEYAPQVSSSALYEQYNADPAAARTNRRAYALTTKNNITVGANGVPASAWEALQWLPFSPLIERYNEKLGKWIGLTVAKYEGAVMTEHSTHDIEITFDLPAINTQF